jgi:DNA-binding NarL/FixJ family response regulator
LTCRNKKSTPGKRGASGDAAEHTPRTGAMMMEINTEALLEKRKGKPFQILIVDDEENVRNVFRDFCMTSPLFDVVTASGGQHAIELALNNDVDIVTMDLIMPEVSGLEAMEAIKREKPHLPMVIVTGNATDNLIRQAGQLGGCRVMLKPVTIDQFLHELIELADEKYGQPDTDT